MNNSFPCRCFAAALMLGIALSAAPVPAVPTDTGSPSILDVRGSVYIKPTLDAVETRLTAQNFRTWPVTYRCLFRCDKDGLITVARTASDRFVLSGPTPWTPLPHVPSAASRAKLQMDEYAVGGGRARDDRSDLFCPAPQSVIRPDDLLFRWTPRPTLQTFSLTLRAPDGHTLWHQADITAATGALTSDAARAALRAAATSGVTTVLLTLRDQDGRLQRLRFGLLDPAEQTTLTQDLASWDAQDALARHLGRAAVFARYGLNNAAADEYDVALSALPDDPYLRRQDADAQKQIGNIRRAQELESLPHPPT